MRISDWSSDVCSSDLERHAGLLGQRAEEGMLSAAGHAPGSKEVHHDHAAARQISGCEAGLVEAGHRREVEIGHRLVEHRGRHVARIALRRQAPEEVAGDRSEEHTSELQSLMRNSYAV